MPCRVSQDDRVAGSNGLGLDSCEARAALSDADRACPPARERECRLERAGGLVDRVRREVGDTMRDERPPEVDRLPAAAYELELCRPRPVHADVRTARGPSEFHLNFVKYIGLKSIKS